MFLSLAMTFALLTVAQTPASSPAFRVENANACVLSYTELARQVDFEFTFIWELRTDVAGRVREATWKNVKGRDLISRLVRVHVMEASLRKWRVRPAGRYIVSVPAGRYSEWPSASVARKGTLRWLRISPLSPCTQEALK